jgi:hypothetical protein
MVTLTDLSRRPARLSSSLHNRGGIKAWAWGAALAVGLSAAPAEAGTYGVPAGLGSAGQITGGTLTPPGFFFLRGIGPTTPPPDTNAVDGDVTHEIRLFIEVTGTTLDITIFDPGTGGSVDYLPGTPDGLLVTQYQLIGPCGDLATCAGGSVLANVSINAGNDRLVRLTPASTFEAINAGTPASEFTGLTPGLYELRCTATNASNEGNLFGVDIRKSVASLAIPQPSDPHYNVFTIGRSAAPKSTMEIGSSASCKGSGCFNGQVSLPMVFYTLVDRGCSAQIMNFDADDCVGCAGEGANAQMIDALGTSTSLNPLSLHGEGTPGYSLNTLTIAPATGLNTQSFDYGLYRLNLDPGLNTEPGINAQQNFIDWRVADLQGWSEGNPPSPPLGSVDLNPINPMKMYLPNGYTIASTGKTATPTPPVKPILKTSLQYVSGPNPPSSAGTTRLQVWAQLENPAGSGAVALLNPQISVGVPVSASNPARSIDTGVAIKPYIDGVLSTCTGSTLTTSRAACTFASLAVGSTAYIAFEVTIAPGTATGTINVTGAPTTTYPPDSTTSFGQYSYPNPSGGISDSLGPVCDLRVTTSAVLTNATIRGVRVDRGGTVEFATGTQRGTAGFEIFGTDDPHGRGPLVPLSRELTHATLADSSRPLLYRASTAPIGTRYIVIEEVERGGRRHRLGPFLVGDPKLEAAYAHIAQRLLQAGEQARAVAEGGHRRAARRLRQASAGGTGVQIEVGEPGRVRVAWADLSANGLPAGVPTSRLRLFNQGTSLPFDVLTSGGVPSELQFDATAVDTPYTGRNAYVLIWGSETPAMEAQLTRWADPPVPGRWRIEKNTNFVPSAPLDNDPWTWDFLFGNGYPWPYDDISSALAQFDLPGLQRPASPTVHVRFRFTYASPGIHDVEARLNGTTVGNAHFATASGGFLEGDVPTDALNESGNHLEIVDFIPDDSAWLYLDYLEFDMPQPLGDAQDVAVAPFDSRLPRDTDRAEYLIVSHPDFLDAAQRIARKKNADSHRAVVVNVERAYDRWSGGIVEAGAVRELIKYAWRGGALRYVLLIGGDTFDPQDFMGMGHVSFMPSLYAWDGAWGRVASENMYADADGDGIPDVAIGRLPVGTPDEAGIAADKIERAQTGALGTQLFASDDGPDGFRARAEAAAALLPAGTATDSAAIADGIAPARAKVLAALHAGQNIHYFGHGGPEQWADENLLTTEDVETLGTALGDGLILTWGCLSHWYQDPFGKSLGEALFLAPQGGAYATFGPAGITGLDSEAILAMNLYPRLFRSNMPIGEMIRRAKAAALAQDPSSRTAVEGFVLLGDPALRLPQASTVVDAGRR